MIKIPLDDETRARYQLVRRRILFWASIMTLVCGFEWGHAIATSGLSESPRYFQAFVCVFLALTMLALWRYVIWMRFLLEGRCFVAEYGDGLLMFSIPRKEGGKWKVFSWSSPGPFKIMQRVLEPTGRGDSMMSAMLDYLCKIDPRYKRISPATLEHLASKSQAELEKALEDLDKKHKTVK